MAAFDQVLALRQRFVSLHDARAISGWDVHGRAAVHDWIKRNAAVLRSYVKAHGVIFSGVAQKSNAASVFWGTGLDRGVRYFEDATAAEVWAYKSAHPYDKATTG